MDAFNKVSVEAGFANDSEVIFNIKSSVPSDPPRSAPENVTVLSLTYAVPPSLITILRVPSLLTSTSPFASILIVRSSPVGFVAMLVDF